MSDFTPLKLIALASKADQSLIPALEQVVIFTRMLAYICEVKIQHLPKKPFKRLPCPSPDIEEKEHDVESKGIDFLGLYVHGPSETTVTLYICRILKFCARHEFNREDVIKIVLIHELAHFVTHLGLSNAGEFWEAFGKENPKKEEEEDFAQVATHLLLRVAGYGHLVNVFDAVSHLCPCKYNIWRQTWKRQLKRKHTLDSILKEFRDELLKRREKALVRDSSIDTLDY